MNNLLKFINDPYNPEVNFWLGYEYDLENHKATAMSYYLRAAEFSDDKNLVYESLIRIYFCLKYIGRRPKSIKYTLLNAINCIPDRPEAWYFLSDHIEDNQNRKESYTAACMAELYKNNSKPTLTDINYYDYLPQFQKAVTTWWVGGCNEARLLFKDLLQNYQMNDKFTSLVHNNLTGLNGERFFKIPYTKENYFNLKYKFPDSEKIEKNYSQVYQDMFVLTMLDGKREGTYLEIGTADPIYNNNTYLLEKEFDWYGISIEINKDEVAKFIESGRSGPIIHLDALEVDYSEELKILPSVIDYLQIDCEPAETTYKILEKIPFNKYKFRVITYEHDYYADETKSFREKSRKFLENKGYVMVVGDIAPDKNSTFEDWWVHPELVDKKILNVMTDSTNKVKKVDEYFLTKKYHAEFDTDKYIAENFFSDVNYKGTIVEVGAGPPEFLSNSKYFRSIGWRSICVDPNPKFVKQHQDCGSEIYQYACSNTEGKSNFTINCNNDDWYCENNDGVSFSALDIRYNNLPEHNTQETIEVETITLNTLLNNLNVDKIDVLSIDTEGWELEVMMGFDQEKYKPKVIVLENYENNLKYESFMNEKNYIKHIQLGYNEIYVLKKLEN